MLVQTHKDLLIGGMFYVICVTMFLPSPATATLFLWTYLSIQCNIVTTQNFQEDKREKSHALSHHLNTAVFRLTSLSLHSFVLISTHINSGIYRFTWRFINIFRGFLFLFILFICLIKPQTTDWKHLWGLRRQQEKLPASQESSLERPTGS